MEIDKSSYVWAAVSETKPLYVLPGKIQISQHIVQWQRLH